MAKENVHFRTKHHKILNNNSMKSKKTKQSRSNSISRNILLQHFEENQAVKVSPGGSSRGAKGGERREASEGGRAKGGK